MRFFSQTWLPSMCLLFGQLITNRRTSLLFHVFKYSLIFSALLYHLPLQHLSHGQILAILSTSSYLLQQDRIILNKVSKRREEEEEQEQTRRSTS